MTRRKNKYSIKSILLEEPEETKEADAEESEEESEEEPEAEIADSGESLDGELTAVFIDFETKARKVSANESKRIKLSLIYENQDIDEIDIDVFSAEIARLVKNYDNLIDIENHIYIGYLNSDNKIKEY